MRASTPSWRPTARVASFAWIAVAYTVAAVVAWAIAAALPAQPPWLVVLAADVGATLVVFAFSVLLDNSSVYDPYWSVAPVAIAVALLGASSVTASATASVTARAPSLRALMVTGLVLTWGLRLTWNWARGWHGMGQEDWRYERLRAPMGRAYWLVSLLGFHLMPTVLVYLGCLPLLPSLSASAAPLGALDLGALALTAGSIACEWAADAQLRTFRLAKPAAGTILDTGLWAFCRHPNYLGEIGFWWGVLLFAVAAKGPVLQLAGGPLAITLLFVFISIPMIDRRSKERRPAYATHMKRVPALLPWRLSRRRFAAAPTPPTPSPTGADKE